MSFNPSGLTVKKAIAKLAGMSDEDLSAVYDAELEGKGRKSLLDAITSARDDIREDVVEEVVVEEPAAEPASEEIDQYTFEMLSQSDRLSWKWVAFNRYVRVG
jgi:hypothetical protein